MLAALLALALQEHLPVLTAGEVVSSRIDEEAPVLEPWPANRAPGAPIRWRAFRLEAAEDSWTLELRSLEFDTYLSVRNARGEVVVEDDDGLYGTHARVVVEARNEPLTVYACALHSGLGDFELRVRPGVQPPPPKVEAEAAELRELEELVEVREAGSLEWAQASLLLAKRLYAKRLLDDVRRVIEVALVGTDPDAPELREVRARLLILKAPTLGTLSRPNEAIAAQLEGLPYLLQEYPDDPSLVVPIHNLLLNLYKVGRYEEGLEWAERGCARAARLMEPGERMARFVREQRTTFLRLNGRWAEALRDVGEPRVIRAGDSIEGEITASRLYQETAILDRAYTVGPAHFDQRTVSVDETGDYTLDLRSYILDSYLVLRDAHGNVLAEDDDGRMAFGARIVMRLVAGEVYVLEATGLHNGSGAYTLDVIAGRPDELSPAEVREFQLADARDRTRFVDEWTGESNEFLVAALERAANTYRTLGHYDEMLSLCRRSMELRRAVYGAGSPNEINGRQRMGEALRWAGRSAEAIPYLERARADWERLNGPDDVPFSILQSLARAYTTRGDYERADELYEQAKRVTVRAGGTDNPFYIVTLRDQAGLAERRGRWQESVELSQLAVDWYEQPNSGTTSGAAYLLAEALVNLAFAQTWVDDYESARENYERAIELHAGVYGELSSRVARARLQLAWVMNRQGQYEPALELWKRAHEALERNGSNLTTSQIHGAELMASAGDYEKAFALAKRALDDGTSGLARRLATLPEPMRLRNLANGRWFLGVLMGASARLPGREREVYESVVNLKGLVGRSLLTSRANALAASDPESVATIAELRSVQTQLAAAFHNADAETLKELRDRRVRLEDELARTHGEEAWQSRIGLDDISRALPEGSVLVDLHAGPHFVPTETKDGEVVATNWWNEQRVTAFVLRAGAEGVAQVDLGPAAALEEAAEWTAGEMLAARGVSLARPSEQRVTRLRELLWDPLAEHVGAAELVFVSTFGFLGTVPFEVLRLDDGSHLVEHHAFVYLSDAASLLNLAPSTERARTSLLLVGDVDYDARGEAVHTSSPEVADLDLAQLRGAAGDTWARLSFTASEVEEVEDLYARAATDAPIELLTGAAATEEALKRELSRHAYVHVATHGFFRPEGVVSMWDAAVSGGPGEAEEDVGGLLPGLLSGLVLAGANLPVAADRDDGLLTAEELTWLDLSRCELVALSACETGLGSARGGEGLIGLRRAFHQAGARTVLASLWSVDDRATSDLMASFYRHLWIEGRSRIAALRSAQLDLLRANREQHGEARPETWGAFVLSGEWR
jgi:CHAT domain-containing protein/tetratricopeptide (TPR) repeat protein